MPRKLSGHDGDWLVTCDQSGFEVWASETVHDKDGLVVVKRFADLHQHPQEKVRGVIDRQVPPDARPEPADVLIAGYTWNETTHAWDAD